MGLASTVPAPGRVSEGFRSVCRKLICHADVISMLPHKGFGEKGALQRVCPELVCTEVKLWHLKSHCHEERRGNRFSSHRHIECATENSSPNGNACVGNSCPAGSGSGPVFRKPDSNYFRELSLNFPGIAIPVTYCCSQDLLAEVLPDGSIKLKSRGSWQFGVKQVAPGV